VSRRRGIWTLVPRSALAVVLLVAALVPLLSSTYFTGQVAVHALWLGLVASSLTFLAGEAGMISLAQTALFGVAGYMMAKLAVYEAMNPWLAALVGIGAAGMVGLLLGAIAGGSQGIYFLMITLAFAVVVYLFFSQVGSFGGHTGINGVQAPTPLENPILEPTGIYYGALVSSVAVFLVLRYLGRTPFGVALQGIRDDPKRMSALGYNVRLHRTLGFALGALIAGLAGVLATWHTTRISPGTIDVTRTIEVLVVAVIGGLYRLEGAWIGALVYVLIDTYAPGLSARFETWIGAIFLVIVLLSPDGITGFAARVGERIRRARGAPAVRSEAS
jgi:branched-chain amino acid transport system permease protein